MSQRLGVVLVALALAAPAAAANAQAPSCDQASLGTVACFVRKLCACTYVRGGTMTARAAGYRWDCGVMRPSCGGDLAVPATIDPFLGPLPSALSLDRNQTIINTQTGSGSTNQTVTGDRSRGTVTLPGQP